MFGLTWSASGTWGAAAPTGTWKNSTGGDMTLSAAPSGANGFCVFFPTSAVASPSAVLTGIATTGFAFGQVAAQSGHVYAMVPPAQIA